MSEPELTATEILALEKMSKDRTLEWARRYDEYPKLLALNQELVEALEIAMGQINYTNQAWQNKAREALRRAKGGTK